MSKMAGVAGDLRWLGWLEMAEDGWEWLGMAGSISAAGTLIDATAISLQLSVANTYDLH